MHRIKFFNQDILKRIRSFDLLICNLKTKKIIYYIITYRIVFIILNIKYFSVYLFVTLGISSVYNIILT